jgi:4-hydroxy-tetrahydrodipicolinate synthase
MIPAMKSAIALKTGRRDWIHVRPPLVELSDAQRTSLGMALDQAGFVMPNAHQLA